MNPSSDTRTELIPIGKLMRMVGRKSRTSVYALLDRDPTFPRPVRVPGGHLAWKAGEVTAWIDALPRVISAASGSENDVAASN